MALRIPIVSDWASAQQAFDFIASKFPLKAQDIANKAIGNTQLAQPYTRGTVNLTWTASTTASATVTHSLGVTPAAVSLLLNGSPAVQLSLGADTLTSTQLTIHGLLTAANTVTVPIFWVAYG